MLLYVLRRLQQAVLVVIAMAVLVFLAVYLVGDPAAIYSSPDATADEIEAVTRRLGLDRPVYEQFVVFAANALQGNFGNSFVYDVPATSIILDRMPATFELAFVGMGLAILIGVPLGLYAGVNADKPGAKAVMAGSILGFSLPGFWLGLMLIITFAVTLGWLPSGGRGEARPFLGMELAVLTADGWKHLILPAINLAIYKSAIVIRVTRAATIDVILQDYIRSAYAKGLGMRRIVFGHVLRNVLIPVVTVIGLELGSALAFAVVNETIFSYPGMGKLLIDSINRLDRPVIVAYLMIIVLIFVVINLVVDLLYSMIDPRVQLSGSRG